MTNRQKRKSIYPEAMEKVNITDLLGEVIFQATHEFDGPAISFKLRTFWHERVEKLLAEIDFHRMDYMFVTQTYWCGILTAEPFCEIEENLDRNEEEILNMIKEHHLQMTWNAQQELMLSFFNPTKSPLYRFFNKYKEDGYGQNIPYSVNQIIQKVAEHLKRDMEENLTEYGEWEYAEELAYA